MDWKWLQDVCTASPSGRPCGFWGALKKMAGVIEELPPVPEEEERDEEPEADEPPEPQYEPPKPKRAPRKPKEQAPAPEPAPEPKRARRPKAEPAPPPPPPEPEQRRGRGRPKKPDEELKRPRGPPRKPKADTAGRIDPAPGVGSEVHLPAQRDEEQEHEQQQLWRLARLFGSRLGDMQQEAKHVKREKTRALLRNSLFA